LLVRPELLLVLYAMLMVLLAFHECGHAAACSYGGATPGMMGAGIYIILPVLYTDVSGAGRLGRGGRLRTALGGIYFDVLLIVAADIAYLVSGSRLLLVYVVLQHVAIVNQFTPFLRMDG
jgi:putative peptide zinc metalloprotease protein